MPNTFKPIVNPYRKNKPVVRPTKGTSVPSTEAAAPIKKQWNPQNMANVKIQAKPSTFKPVTPVDRNSLKKTPPSGISPVIKVKSTASASPPVARGLPKVTPTKRGTPFNRNMLKKKNSMKQQLKQEIALLKRRKTLSKLQKEADERRRQKQKEREIKMKELQAMQAERQRIKDENQRQRMEIMKQKEEERLRKQKEREAERLLKQQEREKKLEEKRFKDQERHKEHCEAYQKYLVQCHQHQQKALQHRQEQQKYQAQYVQYIQYARMQAQVQAQAQAQARLQAQVQMQAQMGVYHQQPPMSHLGMAAMAGMMAARPSATVSNPMVTPQRVASNVHVSPNMIPVAAAVLSTGMIASTKPTPTTAHSTAAQPTDSDMLFVNQGPSLPSTAGNMTTTGSVVPAATHPLQPMVQGKPLLPNHMSAFVRPSHIQQPVIQPHMLPLGMQQQQMRPSYMMRGPQPMMGLRPPVAPAPLPYPPVPPAGVTRIWKPWKQARPTAQPRPKPIEIARLCEVTKKPSPFAHYELLEIKLVRPVDETSFGVSLKLFQQSTLVDAEWYDEQTRKRLGLAADPVKSTVATVGAKATEEKTPAVTAKPMVQSPSLPVNSPDASNQKEMNDGSKEKTENRSKTDNKVLVENAAGNAESPKPTVEKHPETRIAARGQVSGESTMGGSGAPRNASNGLSLAKDPTTPATLSEKLVTSPERSKNEQPHAASATPLTLQASSSMAFEQGKPNAVSDKSNAAGDGKPTNDGSLPKAIESAATVPTPNAVVSSYPAFAAKPRKRRRRRVNFSVMLVVDTTKQNGYREKAGPEYGSMLLQPGDIVVSIGGTSIANKTFTQACAVFGIKSEESNNFVAAKLVVARRPKPVARPIAPKLAHKLASKFPKGRKLSNDPKSMALANSNQPFQAYEFAAIADSIIRAIHQPSRLLGQRVSGLQAFEPMTSLFQKVSTLKGFGFEEDGLPARSIPALQTQWIERSHQIESEFRTKHQGHWTKKIEAEGGLQNVTFSSDAQRSSLRQMPRPVRGCRCGREDHEYLHDPKCLLYRDVCRLVPQDILSGLLRTEGNKGSKKKDASLNTVEKGFKDRLVKLKLITEMEEQEARFVVHMEEVQVKQCKKAIFAPTALSSMILSAVFELQREFPTHFVDDEDKDDSDNEEEEEEVTLSAMASDKRTAPFSKQPKSKRQKQNTAVPKMINFRYMLRMLQYISKTWGHVYREPSREDFAWRWELFHGHNSSQGQWESQAKNPRAPNSLPFETIQSGELDVQSAADLFLLRSTVADFYGSVGREFDGVVKRIEAEKEAEKKASMALATPKQSTAVSPLQASTAADPKIKAGGSDVSMADAATATNVDNSAVTSKLLLSKDADGRAISESSDLKTFGPSATTPTNQETGNISAKDVASTTRTSTLPMEAASKHYEMVDCQVLIDAAKENTEPLANEISTANPTVSNNLAAAAAPKDEVSPTSKPSTNEMDSAPTSTASVSPTQSKDVNMPDVSTTVMKEEKKKPLPRLEINQESADYFLMAAHLLNPSTSGLYDELMALLEMEVLKLDENGIPGLAMDWHTNVDIVILEDLDRCFGSDADPEGRFCIHDELRDTLEENWVKSEYGWAMTDDRNDLVFDYDVIDAWREAFQGEMEEQANLLEGVGRYGL
ncbi:MAG: hypothetical protein SGBAC_004412 [Bacillariaceae sp.]